MVFSSPVFLYLFLPLVLVGYFLVPKSGRNIWLLAASLLFYMWGEGWYVLVLVFAILFNWLAGLALEKTQDGRHRRIVLGLAVAIDLGLLVVYKYTHFIVELLANLTGSPRHLERELGAVHLPIGISFFTFQAISYIVDVYRREVEAAPRLVDYATYKAFFPQLIAGPIIRYRDVAGQMQERTTSMSMFARGIERFVIGLAKKVLIANLVATAADQAFALSVDGLSFSVAWWGILCYSLQIYFDFSGYSDMAIGMGLMFGFHFKENFNLPYSAASIREFWRRWHMSLSTWFRDYLYIPLGGNRGSQTRAMANLVIVFLLCGLWHGAQWTFVVWGAYHGIFIAAEHLGLETFLQKVPRLLRHGYAVVIIMIGWTFFRADTLADAWVYLLALLSPWRGSILEWTPPGDVACAVVIGVLGACGVGRWIVCQYNRLAERPGWAPVLITIRALSPLLLLVITTVIIFGHGHSPFIYFRF